MYTLIAENQYGEQMELTHNPAYCISGIDGIDPPDASINTTRNAGADGSVYNSSYINERTISITLAVNGPAEVNRIALYRFFKVRFPVRLYYSNASRRVYIDGYVQSITVGYFDTKQTAQIVILCPKPLLNSVQTSVQEFAAVENLFEFPFSIPSSGIPFSSLVRYVEKSIINDGDVETGVIIYIKATDVVRNPKIYNVGTSEHYILNLSMAEADEIIINTRRGEKSVVLRSGGTTQNVIGALEDGSSWFTLAPGDNLFTVAADAGQENMLVTVEIINQYEGV